MARQQNSLANVQRSVSFITESHLIRRIGWLRASVLGANDGILSTASIVSGMAAGGASHNAIMLAGLASLVAGATAMATGEYVSVSSQTDTENADLAREKQELEKKPAYEMEELAQIYVKRGVTLPVARTVAEQLMAHDALSAHAHDELGISEITTAKPIQAALSSAASFSVGALLPLIVTFAVPSSMILVAVIVSTMMSLAALGIVGAKAGGAHALRPTIRVLFWGALSLGLTTLVGILFGITS